MIEIQCKCGERYSAQEAHVGRQIRCRCGRRVTVERPTASAADALGAAGEALVRTTNDAIGAARRVSWRLTLPWAPVHAPTRRGQRWSARTHVRVVRTLAWLSWIYVLGAIGAAIVLWTLADKWWPATAALFGPRWVLLTPLALLMPAAVLVRRHLLLPLLAGAVVVLVPVMGLRLHWSSDAVARDAHRSLRVLTFNAEGGEIIAPVLPEVLEDWDADVVALQECGRELGAAVAKLPPAWHHHDNKQGLCLVARYPIASAEQIDRKGFERVRESALGGTSDAMRYGLETPARRVHVVNVHLETPRTGFNLATQAGNSQALKDNTMLRELESRLVRDWVARSPGAFVVAGDFNMPVASAIYRSVWGDLLNGFSDAGLGFGMTKYNGWIRVRIDHVLAGPGWNAVRARVEGDRRSDHRPMVVDLEWDGWEKVR